MKYLYNPRLYFSNEVIDAPAMGSAGANDMVIVNPFEAIAVFTGIYVLTDLFTGTPDATVDFAFGVGGAKVSTKDEIFLPREFGVESTIFAGL